MMAADFNGHVGDEEVTPKSGVKQRNLEEQMVEDSVERM